MENDLQENLAVILLNFSNPAINFLKLIRLYPELVFTIAPVGLLLMHAHVFLLFMPSILQSFSFTGFGPMYQQYFSLKCRQHLYRFFTIL